MEKEIEEEPFHQGYCPNEGDVCAANVRSSVADEWYRVKVTTVIKGQVGILEYETEVCRKEQCQLLNCLNHLKFLMIAAILRQKKCESLQAEM